MNFGRIFVGIAAVVIFILIIVLIFTGGSSPKPSGPQVQPLPTYSDTDATVSLISDGIINGDEMHRQIEVTIGQNSRELDIIQGYSGKVINSKSFYNSQDAYSVFLKAINNENFLAKDKGSKVPQDSAGQCPLGFRYTFLLSQNGEDLSRTWTSSCNAGTSKANLSALLTLFQDQIPNYDDLTSNVDLSATTTQ